MRALQLLQMLQLIFDTPKNQKTFIYNKYNVIFGSLYTADFICNNCNNCNMLEQKNYLCTP